MEQSAQIVPREDLAGRGQRGYAAQSPVGYCEVEAMKIPFDKDLSRFDDEALRDTLRFLRRAWCKPWVWHLALPAYIAIYYELEWREALRK